MKTVSKVLLILAASFAPAFAAAPVWDSSGNGQLNGTYYFRQVIYQSSGGGLAGAYTYYGNMTFSGSGAFSVTSGTFVEYTSQGTQVNAAATGTGTYSVSASGYGFMTSPVTGANIIFMVSNGIIVGSTTENNQELNDMFVAAPATNTLSLASLSGTYTIASMFPNADATYQLSPNGAASFGVNISGYLTSGSQVTQNSTGVKIAYSNGAYAISFPGSTTANFYDGITLQNGGTGSLFLYSSPDSNFVFGGTQYGFDMFVGVRNAGGANTPVSGLYYETGIDNNANTGLDTYYGSLNAFSGDIIGHQRLLSAGYSPEGLTYHITYPTNISGAYTDSSGTVNYTIGQNLQGRQYGVRIGYGTAGYPSLEVAIPFTPPAATGSIYLDPTGIVNTASSAPYTAGISPGEFVTIYTNPGANLASATASATGGQTFPTSLGGVTVVVDGVLNAPIYYVSSSQISFIVPYEVSTYPIASIQVKNNSGSSNIVTTYVNLTTPGAFTPDYGIGYASMIDYPVSGAPFIVNNNQPASGGDTIVLFLSGLGVPFPPNPDGAPGVFDSLVQTINVDVGGVDVGTPGYLGLAPGEPGLYQINFTLPGLCTTAGQTGCVPAGNSTIGISGPDSYTDEALIPISSVSNLAVQTSQASPDTARRILPRLRVTPTH